MSYEVIVEWTARAKYLIDTNDESEAIDLAESDTLEPIEYTQTTPSVKCKFKAKE